jgi:hypothetical protein
MRTCGTDRFAFEYHYAPGVCEPTIRAFELDEQLPPYTGRLEEYGCEPVPTSFEVWKVSPVAIDTFPEMREPAPTGRLDLKPESLDGYPDYVRSVSNFFDTAAQERCEILPTKDGAQRCIPDWLDWNELFLDAECSVPVYENSRFGCDKGKVPKYVRSGGWSEPATVFEVRDEVPPGTQLYRPKSGVCAQAWPVKDPAFLLQEVSPDLFVEAVRSIE